MYGLVWTKETLKFVTLELYMDLINDDIVYNLYGGHVNEKKFHNHCVK